ncbi:hypothetical protein M441DRAFT_444695 [Trichoderma asperellum CBS 433.97]|uniref:Enoyl reductase (ER) domain-containing protein n=1 Tax=Trichoderma asperellum (strain ATCC 204424 / CBS 433.97 / NBRC 101777) TaxID=1042311 RepID=A0A2T3ZMW6_TRIA4|nr:hypothetical protein M441DRAFT_444695 [Trichoderma asperellum CBS 433.97]PTB46141.1 hypothetical protein M441DRAFT_444695 [Trichoderma asperellum CBS 433.97]
MASEHIPKTVKQWNVGKFGGFDGLMFSEQPLPELSDNEVLVKLEAASLNHRDLTIDRGEYLHGKREGVVPGSDGTDTVVAIGKRVSRFQPGDKVVTMFNQGHIGGDLNPQTHKTGTGGMLDGVLRTYGAFNEHALSGTGGVSIFALQFAKAAGARVIATTRSPSKVETLKKLGADHVISYKEDRKWGETARKLTGGRSVDIIVQVAGVNEMEQRPVIDERVFKLEELKKAYEYQWTGKHFSKVVVEIN